MSFYGDFMTALSYTLFLPVYTHNWWTAPVHGAWSIVFFLGTSCIVHWMAWYHQNTSLSVVANLLQYGCFSTMAIFCFPYGETSTLIPQFLFSLIQLSGNTSFSFAWRAKLGLLSLTCAIAAATWAPPVKIFDVLPVLLAATMFYLAINYKVTRSSQTAISTQQSMLAAQLAFCTLAVWYAYNLGMEIMKMSYSPEYASESGYHIIKMVLSVILGYIAMGAFREQVTVKQVLEGLVEMRGRKIAEQSDVLQMVSKALEASETAIAITDTGHRIIWCNPALRRMIRADLKTKTATAPPTLMEAFGLGGDAAEQCRDCFDPNGERKIELTLGSSVSHFTFAISPFTMQADGHKDETQPYKDRQRAGSTITKRFLVAINDITERRARESAEKEALRAALQKKAAMKESMQTLSHELRTPLQAIIGMTSLVVENSASISLDEALECMDTVMASSRLLLTLINNLLDVRKMDEHMMNDFQLFSMPMAPAMRETTQFCRPIALINDVDLDLCLFPVDSRDSLIIASNPVRFQQVLVNLVSNAIKFTRKGSTIVLRSELLNVADVKSRMDAAFAVGLPGKAIQGEQVAVISVEDSGSGIPEEMQKRLFGRFSNFDVQDESDTEGRRGSITAQPSGTGLGLNLCLKFIERMDGNIWAYNKPEGGACFSFYLPLATNQGMKHPTQSVTVAEDAKAGRRSQQSSGVSSYEGLRILVVDDTTINLKVLDRMIKRISTSHRVMTANSGAQALLALERDAFDLVITDIQMPEMNGFELSEAISRGNYSSRPMVVALTADTSESLHRRCAAVGISHVLHKPISSTQFQSFFDLVTPQLFVPRPVQ